jgi:hypothetical protein
VSTILKVARMPAASRLVRTSTSEVPQSSAIRRSAKPICFACLSVSWSERPSVAMIVSNSTISRMFSRNQGSMALSAKSSWVDMPRR